MFNIWKRNKKEESGESNAPGNTQLPWDKQAEQALQQAVSQAPLPGMLKNRLKRELAKEAEKAAKKAGHKQVTAEDLMAGLMEKLPANMRSQVEQAAKEGPEGLKKLQKKLGK